MYPENRRERRIGARNLPRLLAPMLAALLQACGGGQTGTTSSSTTTNTCGLGSAVYQLLSGTATKASASLTATAADESAACAANYGTTVDLTEPTITSSGASSSTSQSGYYGLDAAVLAYGTSATADSGASIVISGGTIKTTGAGASGVFASGLGSAVTLSDTVISTSGSEARAVAVAYAGTLAASNLTAVTYGASSPLIASGRAGGTVTVTGGSYKSSGYRSAGIYAIGAVVVTGAQIQASDAEAVVVEGTGSATLTGTTLRSSNGDDHGVLLYNSGSGDATTGSGSFTMTGGTLTFATAVGSAFAVANSTGEITLTGVGISNSAPDLLTAAAISSWGTSGTNGGNAILSASAQTLSGNVVVDAISTAALTLTNGSRYTGTINAADSAQSVSLSLDASSAWEVTGTSYLTVLTDTAGISGTSIVNIVGNGYVVYYLSSANTALGGLTYALSNGGYLVPR